MVMASCRASGASGVGRAVENEVRSSAVREKRVVVRMIVLGKFI